ncbi:MAG: hypothetical protein RBU21_10295 [FCB group bacterium]|jgi:hypothetical protein|nr:hypothetical protein [FCB group bacterium]
MSVAESSAGALHKAPFYLELHPLGGSKNAKWWICLEDDILTLKNNSDASVLQLHRSEAARYVRVQFDVVRGRILTFSAGEGLKKYAFRIGKAPLLTLLTWFPHKSPAERVKEIRISSASVCLFGVVHLLLAPYLDWEWGALLLLAGGWGLLLPARECHAANGMALVAAGLWSLFPWSTPGLDPRVIPWDERLIPLISGSLLITWGIQQFAMLSPNQALRAARAIRDRKAACTPGDSRIVRRTGIVALVASALLGVYALVATSAWVLRAAPVPPNQLDPLVTDAVAAGGISIVSACAAFMLLFRRTAVYREAKATGLLVLVAGVLAMWAAIFAATEFATAGYMSFEGVIGKQLGRFAQPYVWGSLVPFAVLYSRWFTRAVDRELEEFRD